MSFSHNDEGKPRPLDDSLYSLDQQEYEFLSLQTGIKDPEELKMHVLAVQEEIYKVSKRYRSVNIYCAMNLKAFVS
jgi:hypothetical protein